MIPQYILTLNFECFPISLRKVLLHRVSNDFDHHPLSIHFFLIFQIKHLFQAALSWHHIGKCQSERKYWGKLIVHYCSVFTLRETSMKLNIVLYALLGEKHIFQTLNKITNIFFHTLNTRNWSNIDFYHIIVWMVQDRFFKYIAPCQTCTSV